MCRNNFFYQDHTINAEDYFALQLTPAKAEWLNVSVFIDIPADKMS
jgi:hypothetical protein